MRNLVRRVKSRIDDFISGKTPDLNLTACQITSKQLPSILALVKQLEKAYTQPLILNLSKNNLTKLEPNSFQGLASLKKILLEDNEIEELIPGCFHGLPALTEISLINNKIKTLRENTFVNLSQLSTLYLDGNELNGFFVDKLAALRVLGLSRNKIHDVPARLFFYAPLLVELDLSNNQIAHLSPDLFKELNLQRLELFGNRLQNVPDKIFDGLRSLVALDLSDNPLSTDATTKITHALSLLGLEEKLDNKGEYYAKRYRPEKE